MNLRKMTSAKTTLNSTTTAATAAAAIATITESNSNSNNSKSNQTALALAAAMSNQQQPQQQQHSTTTPTITTRRATNSINATTTMTTTTRTTYKTAKMLMISCYLILVSICALTQFDQRLTTVQAKPLNQNQVRFRRLPPKEFSAALGSSITIECEAGASPPATIHWLKNGKRISQNEFDDNQLDYSQSTAIQADEITRIALSATRSRLFIDCADFQDEAVYTCVAENAYSRVSSHTKLNLIKPTVAVVAAAAGGDGNTNDNDLLASVGPLTGDEVAALELAANGGDGGDGTAPKPTDKLSAIPQCLSQRNGARATEPVRIHMWTHNIVEIMKNNLVLYCRSNIKRQQQQQQQSSLVSNSQQPQQQQSTNNNNEQAAAEDQEAGITLNNNSNNNGNDDEQSQQQQQSTTTTTTTTNKRVFVSWTLPDDKLVSAEQKDKYEILETGDLLIKDLRWSDMGSYVCTVSDEQSSDSISAFVYPASVKANNSKRAAAASINHQASLMSNFNR